MAKIKNNRIDGTENGHDDLHERTERLKRQTEALERLLWRRAVIATAAAICSGLVLLVVLIRLLWEFFA